MIGRFAPVSISFLEIAMISISASLFACVAGSQPLLTQFSSSSKKVCRCRRGLNNCKYRGPCFLYVAKVHLPQIYLKN